MWVFLKRLWTLASELVHQVHLGFSYFDIVPRPSSIIIVGLPTR